MIIRISTTFFNNDYEGKELFHKNMPDSYWKDLTQKCANWVEEVNEKSQIIEIFLFPKELKSSLKASYQTSKDLILCDK